MKTLTADQTENTFAEFVDMVKQEPIVITENGSPVSVTLSIKDMQALVREEGGMPKGAVPGLLQGLADAENGKLTTVNSSNKTQFINDIISQLDHRKTA